MDVLLTYLKSVSPRNLLVGALFTTGFIFIGIGTLQYLLQPRAVIEYKPSHAVQAAEATSLLVDVSGAVVKQGVYELTEGSRIKDALIKAGGLSADADRTYIAKTMNLAQKVSDSMKIYVPHIGETPLVSAQAGKISINTATASELDKLPGIGVTTAEKIIAGRPYSSLEELVERKIVTKKQFDQIKDQVVP